MDISIVIVNYNVEEYIISCIESIYKHSKSKYTFEIIVVDNNSSDSSNEKLKSKFQNIILIENDYNKGFSKAVNQGVKMSQGDYIFLLNPDTILVEDSISRLIKCFNNRKDKIIVGPTLISKNGVQNISRWKFPNLINTILSILQLDFLNFKKNYKFFTFPKIAAVDCISGGAFFLQKEIFFELNGLNENLFWMEDIDFCYRAKKRGYQTYFFTGTKIIHLGGKSSQKNRKIAISNQLISKIKYFKIHHSKPSVYLIVLAVLVISLFKALLIIILFPFSTYKREKSYAYFFTFYSVLLKKY